LVTGFVAGATQQLRGAHFMSHTLWTAWICWAVGALTDSLFTKKEEAPATLLIQ
jgi:membrane-associated PAP2 superfamily phosphatase